MALVITLDARVIKRRETRCSPTMRSILDRGSRSVDRHGHCGSLAVSGRGTPHARATTRPCRTSAARGASAAARSEPRPDPSLGAEAAARPELQWADRSDARADRYRDAGGQEVAAARASRARNAGSWRDGALHRDGPSGSSSSPKDTSPVPPGRFETAPVSSSMVSSERPPRRFLSPPGSTTPLSGSYSLGVRRGVGLFGAAGAPLSPFLRVDVVVASTEGCCLEP